ncbi:MAG: PilZ domain-containing protein [Fusobacteriaceae bacterium]|jgi:c-di-GMP-binding flagellar brake protein YcgR|nr:PilZ domain-containing protein [Fusobacteriaceae bacterium]MBP9597073.1 PilZ domain-containing protein [Fusobacteriaceae bacterium]
MDPIKMLKIGTLVEMEVINNVYDGELFLTKISDIDESHETLDLNLPMENRQYVIARNGEQVKVSVKKDDGIYCFKAKIQYRALEPYAHIRVEFPKKMIKEQRREFFRMPVNLMIALKKEDEEKSKQGVSIDLSGGGFCLTSRALFEKNDIVIMNFDLTNGTRIDDLKGIVKWRVNKSENQYEYGVEFLNLDNKLREQFISYLFELQRNRKKI